MTELRFVGPEEAKSWPEGQNVLCLQRLSDGKMFGVVATDFSQRMIAMSRLAGYTHYLRLPDSLPEVERNE